MKRITAHQWTVMSSLLLLGPALRLLPRLTAEQAGRAAWLAALAALPPLLLYVRFLSRFWQHRPVGTGLSELTMELLGPRFGRGALGLLCLWLLFYAGFVLRCAANRLVVTIYPQSGSAVFVLSLGLICLLAAAGSVLRLARAAKLLLPPVLGILLLLLIVSLPGINRANLFPVTVFDLPELTRAALPVLDVLGLGLFLPLFFRGFVEDRERPLLLDYTGWLLRETALLTLLMLAVVGNFGAAMVSRLSQPFFTLVRNLVFFRSLERIEALVVACWIFPDFLLASLCLSAAQNGLRLALGESGRPGWLAPLCGAAAIGVGLFLAPDVQSLRLLSETVVPLANLALSFLTVPLLALAERRRQKKAL